MRSLVEVHAEEAALIFCGVNWESPFHKRPFFEVVESLLNAMQCGRDG